MNVLVCISAMTGHETLERVRHGYRMPKPYRCPDSVYRIMRQCWDENAEKRPSFNELHEFLDNFFVSGEPEDQHNEDNCSREARLASIILEENNYHPS